MGDYIYPASGSNSVRPHAVKQIPGIGAHEYDDNGNLLSTIRSSRWVNIDMPKRISKGEADSSQFTYGPEHQRSKHTKTSQPNGNPTVTTTYYAGAQEAEVNNGQATVKTYWPYGLGVEIDQPGSSSSELHWSHHDRLGSIISITDASGNLKEKLAYDSWGKRRTTDGSATPDNLDGQVDNKGYTGHEMLDQLDLVHMNGRIYDPLMARFLSADPLIQDPAHSQSYNRYTYVWNNPTNLTDPTGFVAQDTWIDDELKRQAAKDPFGNWSVVYGERKGSVTAENVKSTSNSSDNKAITPKKAETGVMTDVNDKQLLNQKPCSTPSVECSKFNAERAEAVDRWQERSSGAVGSFCVECYVAGTGSLLKAGYASVKGLFFAAADEAASVVRVVTVSRSRYPQSAQHIEDAQAAGQPSILTVDRAGASARRQEALKKTPTKNGADRDEYPPAMFKEGGKGSSVRHIKPSDNRGSGSCIGAQCRNLPNGSTVKLEVTN